MLEHIAFCCAEHLRKLIGDNPTFSLCSDAEQIAISFGDERYTIIVDDFDDDDDDAEQGSTLEPGRSVVEVIDASADHTHLLDACLDALSNDELLQPAINNLTTDGGSDDCEAIFNVENYGQVILKVR